MYCKKLLQCRKYNRKLWWRNCWNYDRRKIENSYYIENKVNSENGQEYVGTEVKTSDEIKEIYTELGNSFKEDSNNINNGFLILSWQ